MNKKRYTYYFAIAWILFGISLAYGELWTAGILLTSIFVVLGQNIYRRSKKLRKVQEQYRAKIEKRKKLNFAEFSRIHYPTYEPAVICTLLEKIEAWVNVPMDRLEPTDHLVSDLGIWDGLAPNHLIFEMENAFGVKFDRSFLSGCTGELGDFIEKFYVEIDKQQQV